MSATHVTGPWQVDEYGGDRRGLQISHLWTDEDGTHTDEIADVVMDYATGIAEANAALLSAAPDLLDALRAIIAEEDRLKATGDCITNMCDLIDAARPAVAKAEGR